MIKHVFCNPIVILVANICIWW